MKTLNPRCHGAFCCIFVGILVAGLILWAFLNPLSTQGPSHNSSWMVSISQLANLVQVFNPGAVLGTIRNAFAKVSESEKRKATPPEVAWLVQHQVVLEGANNVQFITIPAAMRVLKQFKVPGTALTDLKDMKTGQPIQPPPQQQQQQQQQHLGNAAPAPAPAPTLASGVAAAAAAGPSTAAGAGRDTYSPCILQVLPHNLPVLTLSQDELRVTRYGISTHSDLLASYLAAVEAQLQLLAKWWMEPIQLNRPKEISPIGEATWQGYKGELQRFLGYCRMFQGVEEPSLHHILNAHLVLHFISFLRGRGVKPHQLYDIALKASRVTVYLHSNNLLSPTCTTRLQEYLHWLENLAHQCSHNLQPVPAPSLAELEEQGRWIDPVLLIQSTVNAHTAACQLLPTNNSSSLTRQAAVKVMEVAMCCFFCAFIPPMRPSVVITLQHPAYTGDCLHPKCQHKSRCKGDRLEWALPPPTPGSPSSTIKKLRLVAPHHKTRPDAKEKLIAFFLPAEMQEMMRVHLTTGISVISQRFSYDTENGLPPTVFITASTGKQMSPQQVSQVFQRTVVPSGYRISPRVARACFSTLVRDDAMQNGFGVLYDEDGAAAVMGNSIEVWNSFYDRKYAERRAQEAVDSLARFRQSLVASANPAAVAGAGAGVGVAAAVVAATVAAAGVGGAAPSVQHEVIEILSDTESESESELESETETDSSSMDVSDTSSSDDMSGHEGGGVSSSDEEFLDCMSE